MTIREALETVDRLKPNQYGSADKLRWLSELDGAVYREILTQPMRRRRRRSRAIRRRRIWTGRCF